MKSEGTFAVGDFVIVSYDGDLCPGQVLDLDEGDFQVSMIVRSGKYWKWLEIKDGIWYTRSAVQRKVAPPEEFGMCQIF